MSELDAAQKEVVKDFSLLLIDIAHEQGEAFRAKHGRNPTQREAGEIPAMIQRQAATAIAMHR